MLDGSVDNTAQVRRKRRERQIMPPSCARETRSHLHLGGGARQTSSSCGLFTLNLGAKYCSPMNRENGVCRKTFDQWNGDTVSPDQSNGYIILVLAFINGNATELTLDEPTSSSPSSFLLFQSGLPALKIVELN